MVNTEFGTRRHRLGQSYCDACLVTSEDLQAAEVAAIGHGIERLGLENSLGLLGHIGMARRVAADAVDVGQMLS